MENTNVNQEVEVMELLPTNAEYRDIAAKAKELGLSYVGVKKDALLEEVNAMIAKINNGEAEVPAAEASEINEENEENENEGTETPETGTPSPAQAAAKKAAGKQKERTVRQAAKKWFEEPGANPYNEGDVVEIIGGKYLIGRKLQVLEPSAKKDMVKGKLIHPVTGGLQNTVIAIAFERIQLVESANEIAADEPKAVEDNQEGVETPVNEEITAEAEETIEVPEMEVEENEEAKAE